MGFRNRIRLPFQLHKPQFLEEAERYRKANGTTVTLSVVVRKVYEGLTDRLPEKLHERLKIALVHDHVEVEGDKYVGVVTQEGDYQIEWQDFLSHPLAQGKFKAEVTPFNATNSNCGTCQEVIQVVANDDDLGALNEGATGILFDPLANDDICCNPVTITLVTTNATFINNVVIHPNNFISFDVKSPVPDAVDVVLLTYRAQCQNGQYDDANVIADINGSVPACLAPANFVVVSVTDTTATLNWDDVVGAVSYDWVLFQAPDYIHAVFNATIGTSDVVATSLQPNTSYRVLVRANCASGSSNYVSVDFTTDTAPPANACGSYELYNTDDLNFRQGSYTDCDGIFRGINIAPSDTRKICVLQNTPGSSVDLNVEPEIAVEYRGLC
jgi:hypothetical protein